MGILVGLLIILALAFAPMIVYALILCWFDRYEKEPVGLIVVAFLWGAVPAVVFSLIAQLVFDVPISALVRPGMGSQLLSASVVAPLTEELFKGAALLLLLVFFRHEIDSPLDGIIYGGLVGFGFAATENAFYFLGAFGSGGLGAVLELSFFRALVFGLNHALFTGCTGLGFALARTSPNWGVKIGAPVAGLAAGMALHAIHNTGATLGAALCWPLLVSLLVNWSGVLALMSIVIWASLRERRLIAHYLRDEVKVGTIGLHDYGIIQSYRKRTQKRLRTLFQGDLTRFRLLGRYYHLATKLAFVKYHWEAHGRDPQTALEIEQRQRELYDLRKQM